MTATPVETVRPDTDRRLEEQGVTATDRPWVTIVWNDPVNLMTYVEFVFREYFDYPQPKAHKLMMQVHEEGRAVVANGTREEMERDVAAMHGYGLWATVQQDK